ncbi:MAG: acetamidase/formamidase family protein [Candidatus Velthaea sp.]
MTAGDAFFGCSERWAGARFARALTEFLTNRKMRRELRANDAVDSGELEQRYDAWRAGRESDAQPEVTVAPAPAADAYAWNTTTPQVRLGREWRIPSTPQTVDLGQFDPHRAPLVTIESGDVVAYENTWTHFLNRLQPGVPIHVLAEMRKELGGRGVHSIVGPLAVAGAQPGDLLEIRFLELRTIGFGANFHNSAGVRTGVLPDEFADGYVKYFHLHDAGGYVEFSPRVKLALRPFQGTFGVAAPGDAAVSSIAPGQHAGNIDVKELTAGSTLFVPVWHPGGLIFTGDSHALQGDGEVNITAVETAMELVRCQVILHKRAGYAWPMIETPTHWLMLGIDPSLNEALRIALRNTISFLSSKAGFTRDEAYSLASIGVDFRVSQMVDVNNGIHAMIPKSIFAPDFRETIAICGA